MASALGAGAGADMLQEILRQKFTESIQNQAMAQAAQRLAHDQQRLNQDDEFRKAQLASMQGQRDATARLQAQQTADRLADSLAPGSQLDPNAVETLKGGDLGSLIEHRDATLGSRNLSGVAQAGGAAPRIIGLASAANPGQAAKDLFTGTAGQLAAEQARKDAIAAREAARVERENARTQAVTDKKELMDYAAANRPAAATHPRFNVVQGTDADGKPALIRTNVDTGDVSVLPVPTGANFTKREQPATQDQTNLGLYANRVEQSDPVLKQLQDGISKMNLLSFEGQTRVWDNPKVQSPEIQKYQQASRNFINAVLRRESGAAISPSEFAEARKQYLPVPGDTADVLAQKAQNRNIVLENFKRGAGPAYRAIGGAAPTSGGGAKGDPLGIR